VANTLSNKISPNKKRTKDILIIAVNLELKNVTEEIARLFFIDACYLITYKNRGYNPPNLLQKYRKNASYLENFIFLTKKPAKSALRKA
jgi:hypothetical protein